MIGYDLNIFLRKNGDKKVLKNFKAKEFFCSCGKCRNQLISIRLASKLQLLRSIIDKPIKINSAFRCENHNKSIGGIDNSQHCKGRAADIVVDGMDMDKLASIAEEIGFDGVGIYKNFVHVDTRGFNARWRGK